MADLLPFVYRNVPPLSPYATDEPTLIKLAEAISYQFNRRHTESPYYPLHHHIIATVACYDNLTTHTNGILDVHWTKETGIQTFVKAPHFSRTSKTHDPTEAKVRDPLQNEKLMYGDEASDDDGLTEDEDLAQVWETSSTRSSETIPGKEKLMREGSPDIMVTHIRLSAMDVPSPLVNVPPAANKVYEHSAFKFRIHGGVKIHHRCPALIGEIKPGPPRKKENKPWAVRWYVEDAIVDLFLYAKMVFVVHPYLTEIACYAAAGIYWTWRIVQRCEFEGKGTRYDWGHRRWENVVKAINERDTFVRLFPEHQQVGTEESDGEYTRMRRDYFYRLANDWQPKPISPAPARAAPAV